MNLRKKTLLMIGATLLALVLILYATSQIILVTGLTNLEEDNIKQDAARFEEAILIEEQNLNAFTRDMASSDETYNFMLNQNQQFIDHNLDDNLFSAMGIDLVLFFDNQGHIIYVKRLDQENQALSALPEGMGDYNSLKSLFFNNSTPSSGGILNLPNTPLLISVSPVTGSNTNSTVRGTVLMGRNLNKHFISSFSNFTQLQLELSPYNLPEAGRDLQDAQAAFNRNENIFITYNGSESISAYGFLNDIENNPAIIFKITDSRLYYAKTLNSIYYFMAMIIIAGFIMGFSILIYLDKSVLSSLSQLGANIKFIGEKKDFSARFPVSGDDEFSLLTRSLNKMMEKLENSHLTLQKSETKFRQLAENIDEVFGIYDLKKKRFIYLSPAFKDIWGRDPQELYDDPRKWKDYLDGRDKVKGIDLFSKIKNNNLDEEEKIQFPIKRPDNSIRWIEARLSPVKDHSGNVNRVVGIATDITRDKEAEYQLKSTKKRLDFLISATPAIIYTLSIHPPHKTTFISNNVKKQTGYSPDDFLKDSYFWMDRIHPDDVSHALADLGTLLQKGQHYYEYRFQRRDGKFIWMRDEANVIMDDKGQPVEIAGYWINITKRKEAEEAQKESERTYKTIFENTGTATVIMDKKMDIMLLNTEFEKLSGYSREEIQAGMNMREFTLPGDLENYYNLLIKVKNTPYSHESSFKTREGKIKEVIVTLALIPGTELYVSSFLDITDHKMADNKLKASLKEKEVLLQELHHRVKNNLQVISSLLSLQSRYLTDKKSQELFNESQNRVRSMTLIHEMLYKSPDLSQVGFKQYIKELSSVLLSSYGASKNQISFKMEVGDIYLDINKAIPCGLILNELITNSLKHAFGSGPGEIKVSFQKKEPGTYALEVEDNGVGIPEDIDINKSKSLGLRLVRTLTQQLGGSLSLEKVQGTKFKIIFK